MFGGAESLKKAASSSIPLDCSTLALLASPTGFIFEGNGRSVTLVVIRVESVGLLKFPGVQNLLPNSVWTICDRDSNRGVSKRSDRTGRGLYVGVLSEYWEEIE